MADSAIESLGTRKRPAWSKTKRHSALVAFLFLSPWIIGFLVFNLYPMLASLAYSFAEYKFHQPLHWIGAQNYVDLFHDPLFFKALGNTSYLVLLSVPINLMTAFLCAIVLNLKTKVQSFYRVIYFIPSIFPTLATVLLWGWIFNPQYGLLNTLLESVHIQGPNWLSDPNWSKPALLIMGAWGVGQSIIVYLSALQDVPVSLLEAAELDGASGWDKMISITLPMVSPVTVYLLITSVIGGFQYFTQAFIFSRIAAGGAAAYSTAIGAPQQSTLFYGLYLYQVAFQHLKFGYASAMAWILFLIILACTILMLKFSDQFSYYSG